MTGLIIKSRHGHLLDIAWPIGNGTFDLSRADLSEADLAPCDEMGMECRARMRVACPSSCNEHEWHVAEKEQ